MLFAALAIPFWAGCVYTADDLGAFHLPLRAYYAQQLASGESFDWMPQLYCGFYVTGEGQLGGYHPIHWLLYRYLSLPAAFGLELLLSYPFMMVGMWLFLRRHVKRSDVAWMGALLFTFCTFNLLHLIHPNAIAIIAHIPWLLWAIDIVLVEARRYRVRLALVLVAILTGSQLLLGYPQYVWFSWLLEFCYAGFILYTRRYAPRRECDLCATCDDCIGCTTATWPRLIVAKVVGVLLGGVQWLPTADALMHSGRPGASSDFTFWGSLNPLNVIQLVAPYMFENRVWGGNTHEFGVYVGAVSFVLALWVWGRRHELGPLRNLAFAAACMAIFAFVMALGENGPLYRVLALIPVLNTFRFPCRYLILFQFAMAVLAAIGFFLVVSESQRAFRCGRHGEALPLAKQCLSLWYEFELLWIVVAISMAIALTGWKLRNESYIASVPAILAGPVLFAAAVILVALAVRGRPIAIVGLIGLAAADLGYYGMSYSVYSQNARYDQWVNSSPTPPKKEGGRVLASLMAWDEPGLRTGNRMLLAGLSRADGYSGLEPKRKLDYSNVKSLRAAGVRWVARNPQTEEIAGLKPFDSSWLEVPKPMPRIRLVTKSNASFRPDRDIQNIALSQTALTETPLELPSSTPGHIQMHTDQPGNIVLDVECPAPQLLVLGESFHPGWKAVIDGHATKIQRVNGDFMGCVVGPGQQHVVLSFHPKSLEYGWFLTTAGLGLLLLYLISCLFFPGTFSIKAENHPSDAGSAQPAMMKGT
jgi:hypothetical protein